MSTLEKFLSSRFSLMLYFLVLVFLAASVLTFALLVRNPKAVVDVPEPQAMILPESFSIEKQPEAYIEESEEASIESEFTEEELEEDLAPEEQEEAEPDTEAAKSEVTVAVPDLPKLSERFMKPAVSQHTQVQEVEELPDGSVGYYGPKKRPSNYRPDGRYAPSNKPRTVVAKPDRK